MSDLALSGSTAIGRVFGDWSSGEKFIGSPKRQSLFAASEMDWTTAFRGTSQSVAPKALEKIKPTSVKVADPVDLGGRLAEARGEFRRLIVTYSNYFEPGEIGLLINRVEQLLSVEGWQEEDLLPNINSTKTFVRFMQFVRPFEIPNVGINDTGHILSGWLSGPNQLFFEFKPSDEIEWYFAGEVAGREEYAAGIAVVQRIPAVLAPYDPQRWFRRV